MPEIAKDEEDQVKAMLKAELKLWGCAIRPEGNLADIGAWTLSRISGTS